MKEGFQQHTGRSTIKSNLIVSEVKYDNLKPFTSQAQETEEEAKVRDRIIFSVGSTSSSPAGNTEMEEADDDEGGKVKQDEMEYERRG